MASRFRSGDRVESRGRRPLLFGHFAGQKKKDSEENENEISPIAKMHFQ
jgi:hypothetical protein